MTIYPCAVGKAYLSNDPYGISQFQVLERDSSSAKVQKQECPDWAGTKTIRLQTGFVLGYSN
jgi:hypothetical protein